MANEDLTRTIDLLERMRELGTLWLPQSETDPFLNMSLHVMKRHLTGQLVTPTSLAQAAGVPYTTATRRVKAMLDKGLLDTRPRTRSGRTVSLHPSPALVSSMTGYLTGVRAALQQNPLPPPGTGDDSLVIPPPALATATPGFGTALNILVPDDPAYSISKRLRRELSYLMGGKVKFSGSSIDDLRNRLLSNARHAVSEFDVVAVDLPWISEFASRGILMPLDEVASPGRINSADFVASAWRGTISGGQQYAIPMLINPQLLFYRTDLFRQAGIQPPRDTDQLLETAKKLHDPAAGRYGVSWTAKRGGPIGQAFIQFLADHGQPVFHLERSVDGYKTDQIDPATLRPAITTERGHVTARFMLELLEVSPPEVLQFGWGGQVDLLREGRVAMAYEWASRAAQLVSARPIRELGFLPHPVGVVPGAVEQRNGLAPIGGFAFGIPANIDPARLDTAWSAIEWLSSPEVIKLLVQHGGYVTPRVSVGMDPDVRRVSPMIGAVDQMARAGQIRLWPRPPVATYSAVVEILGEEIHDMLLGKRGIAEALGRAQDRADDLHESARRHRRS